MRHYREQKQHIARLSEPKHKYSSQESRSRSGAALHKETLNRITRSNQYSAGVKKSEQLQFLPKIRLSKENQSQGLDSKDSKRGDPKGLSAISEYSAQNYLKMTHSSKVRQSLHLQRNMLPF